MKIQILEQKIAFLKHSSIKNTKSLFDTICWGLRTKSKKNGTSAPCRNLQKAPENPFSRTKK